MGSGPSKERKLYDSVRKGDVQTIRSLHSQGVSVNGMRSSGKTPLILACSAADRLHVAKALIELGADVNYYDREGSAGTAIHNAAKRGLEQTVILLLSQGANPLLTVVESHRQSALESARDRGQTNIVRLIEDKIGSFSGWLRYISGTRSSDSSPKRTWVVILPGDPSLSSRIPEQMKIALYRGRQSPKPFKVVSLKKFYVHEPNFVFRDPDLVLSNKSSGEKFSFLSGEEGDRGQLKHLYGICSGKIASNIPFSGTTTPPRWPPSLPKILSTDLTNLEEEEIAEATVASIRSAVEEGVPLSDVSFDNILGRTKGGGSDTSPVGNARGTGEGSSGLNATCAICNDAPIEAACVPCGHLAGCMACLTQVKTKEFGCPLCRARIQHIMKVYTA